MLRKPQVFPGARWAIDTLIASGSWRPARAPSMRVPEKRLQVAESLTNRRILPPSFEQGPTVPAIL
eukprot:2500464-Pyramimonas_sp.AAC.1